MSFPPKKSDYKININIKRNKNIDNLIKVWGSEVGLLHCEKFKLIREVI